MIHKKARVPERILFETVGSHSPNQEVPGMNQPTTAKPQKRLRILGDDEIEAIYGQPHFTPEEREFYFSLSSPEKAKIKLLSSIPFRLCCILQLGYFKARHLFFAFRVWDVMKDTQYV